MIFMINCEHYQDIDASVAHGVWTSTRIGNMRIQEVWKHRQGDGKVLLIFSVTGRYVLMPLGDEWDVAVVLTEGSSEQIAGVAEMVGPWDEHAHANCWVLKSTRG